MYSQQPKSSRDDTEQMIIEQFTPTLSVDKDSKNILLKQILFKIAYFF